tara:strand:+ start:363 stop:938 length:576 start_codon:yes stop_codon:yes gene_type:complete
MNTNNKYIDDYLKSIKRQFAYYKTLGDKTMSQLSDYQLFEEINTDSNSVAIIAKHIAGNQLSRWTDFWTTDGEKEWRNRDSEFKIESINSRKLLLNKWEEGWECLFKAIDSINESNFDELIYIRNMGHTIPDAVNRQLCHYSYHVGQMVYIGKVLLGAKWESLSIPKGQSKSYNQDKFAKPKTKKHFTEDL